MESEEIYCDLCSSILTPEVEHPQLSQQGFVVVCDECQSNRNQSTTTNTVDHCSGTTESEN